MLNEDILEFLKGLPASRSLDNAHLKKLVNFLVMKFYPAGTVIIDQQDPSSRISRIIKQGWVMLYVQTEPGQRHIIDYRGEGDTLGTVSPVENTGQGVSALAIDDTVCYEIGKAELMGILKDAPAMAELFRGPHPEISRRASYGEMLRKNHLFGESEKLLFTTPVRELCRKDIVTAGKDISVAEAAKLMSFHHTDSLVIVNGDGAPAGIVTDSDLRNKVLALSKSTDMFVASIMSAEPVAVDSADFCFEALLKMINNNIHHLAVLEYGRVIGMLSSHDFIMLQGMSPLFCVREIEKQETIEGLVSVSGKNITLISLLLRGGAKASNITRIVTELNDRLERRILDIAQKTLGPPPVPFCWIIYGSRGRKEQTFKTDQDNAIVYADSVSDEEGRSSVEYFSRFAAFVVDGLLRCGFFRCSGNYMATNSRWCQPLSVWKNYFSEWISEPTPEAIIASVILFDFRGLYGDLGLASELKQHLMKRLRRQNIFLKCMADMTAGVRPPLSFLRTFRVEDEGEHRNKLDLKKTCVAPLINIVRLFSLESGIGETSTLERIAALKEVNATIKETGAELAQAFEFVSLLRIQHQFDQIALNIEPDNFIYPDRLSLQEKNTLKDVCLLISRVLDGIERKYNPGLKL